MAQIGTEPLGIYGSQKQPLIHHPGALPISAVFHLRYVHTMVRRWAASGTRVAAKCLEVGTRPVEWYSGRMGIRRSEQVILMARGLAAVAACLVLANCASSGKF